MHLRTQRLRRPHMRDDAALRQQKAAVRLQQRAVPVRHAVARKARIHFARGKHFVRQTVLDTGRQ